MIPFTCEKINTNSADTGGRENSRDLKPLRTWPLTSAPKNSPSTRSNEAIRVAICDGFSRAKTIQIAWDDFLRDYFSLSVGFRTKKESLIRRGYCGGPLSEENGKRANNVHRRSLLTLDFDNVPDGVDISDIEDFYRDVPFNSFAHTTYSHTPERPRLRVIAPLSREVNKGEYRYLVDKLCGRHFPASVFGKPDRCSYTMNQMFFLPSHRIGAEQ